MNKVCRSQPSGEVRIPTAHVPNVLAVVKTVRTCLVGDPERGLYGQRLQFR
jgi:hypothetical protein